MTLWRTTFVSRYWLLLGLLLVALPLIEPSSGGEHDFAGLLIGIAAILVLSKLGALLERVKQPPVLGEILVGIGLSSLAFLGFSYFRDLTHSVVIQFLGEVGVILLLFQIGLESNIARLAQVGGRALAIASAGIGLTIALVVWLVAPLLLPDLSLLARLFVGAALASSSVAVSSRILKDAGKLTSAEGQTFLGAAVIDDTLGLIVLSVLSGVAAAGTFSLVPFGMTVLRSLVFLTLAIVIGQLAANQIGAVFARISRAANMKMTIAIAFCFALAYVAKLFGMEPIIGAFAAGLVLDPVHFDEFEDPEIVEDIQHSRTIKQSSAYRALMRILHKHHDKHVEDLIETVSGLFVPIFFVLTGLTIDVSAFLDTSVLFAALCLTVVAYIAKLLAGRLSAPEVDSTVVGLSMVPRGEVGLIFATLGLSAGVFDQQVFATIVLTILLTIITAPGMISSVLNRLD